MQPISGDEWSEWFTFIYLFIFNVYLFLRQRETEHERGWGRERGRHRMGSRLQALSHQPRARCGAQTHEPWDQDLSWSQESVASLFEPPRHAPSFFFLLMFMYIWEKERDSAWVEEGQRVPETIGSRLQAPSCQHRARRGARTHEPWDHDLSRSRLLNLLSHPGAPRRPNFQIKGTII